MVGWQSKVPHLGTVGVNQEWTTEIINDNPQTLVTTVHDAGGWIKINHPTFTTLTISQIESLIAMGYDGMEIYNGLTGDIETSLWDSCLSAGYLVWGIAVDDSHDYVTQGNKAWVVINANSLTNQAVISALQSGNMYATQGPSMSIVTTNLTIRVTTDQPSTIRWIKSGGNVIRSVNNVLFDVYPIFGNEGYMRIEIERNGKLAWSQPFSIY